MLKLLREKIRDQGFTQLKVQEALGWGRTYISQLFRKQKSLRFDQILYILEVVEIDAGEFFAEFYGLSHPAHEDLYQFGYPRPRPLGRYRPMPQQEPSAGVEELQRMVAHLSQLLVEKGVLEQGEVDLPDESS